MASQWRMTVHALQHPLQAIPVKGESCLGPSCGHKEISSSQGVKDLPNLGRCDRQWFRCTMIWSHGLRAWPLSADCVEIIISFTFKKSKKTYKEKSDEPRSQPSSSAPASRQVLTLQLHTMKESSGPASSLDRSSHCSYTQWRSRLVQPLDRSSHCSYTQWRSRLVQPLDSSSHCSYTQWRSRVSTWVILKPMSCTLIEW